MNQSQQWQLALAYASSKCARSTTAKEFLAFFDEMLAEFTPETDVRTEETGVECTEIDADEVML